MGAAAGLPITPHAANLSLVTMCTMHLLQRDPECREVSGILDRGPGLLSLAGRACSWATPTGSMDGHAIVPDAPGWGVEINPDWLAQARHRVSERT